MKNSLILFVSCLLVFTACKAPADAAKSANPNLTVVSFNSICCGVRSDDFLKRFYQSFKTREGIQLVADKVTGCGKEGEYKVMFYTKDLSAATYKRFSEELRSLVETESKTNMGSQQGTVNIETMDTINTTFCRGGQASF